jgi:hypothetical protein
MSLSETLQKFGDAIAGATSDAPDEYLLAQYGYEGLYEAHMADLKELWAAIRPQLKRDLEQAEFIDGKLQEMITAFDAGEKDKGRKAAWAMYNAEVTKLR